MSLKIAKPELLKKTRTIKSKTSVIFPDKEAWGFLFPSILLANDKGVQEEVDLAIDALSETPGVNLHLETLKMFSDTEDDIIDEIFFQQNLEIDGKRCKRFGACMPGATRENMYEAMQKYIILVEDELGYYF